MSEPILITGSSGLVGSALRRELRELGVSFRCLDLRATDSSQGDVRDRQRLDEAVQGCGGIVHLAAVSRVIWGERDPDLCWSTNVGGLRNLLEIVTEQKPRPWVVFASSREVYGQPEVLPATEETPLRPMNVYGRSKVEGERLVNLARDNGVRVAIARLSNVFGSTRDHADRVVPAFARAAARGQPLRVDGADNTFDFTHIDDVARGIVLLTRRLEDSPPPPPIHFVAGVPTTLGQLAAMAVEIAKTASPIQMGPPRDFDVATFYGLRSRARALLGWTPQVSLRQGVKALIEAFRNDLEADGQPATRKRATTHEPSQHDERGQNQLRRGSDTRRGGPDD